MDIFTTYKKRGASGQGWLALCLIIGVFIVLPLGLLGFDICRYSFASQQMRSAVDAAALSGVATLAASPTGGSAQFAHEQAARDAWETFKKNSIFGYALTACPDPVPTYINASPKPTDLAMAGMNVGDSRLYIDFLKPDRTPALITDPDGKVMRVTGLFGYAPIFGVYLGFSDLLLRAGSDGAVPTLDIELCFDVSGSMDDSTYVYLVNRLWVGNDVGFGGLLNQKIYHWVRREGKIYNDIIKPGPGGTRVNALPPQNLKEAGKSQDSGYFGYTQPASGRYSFSEKNWGRWFSAGNQTRGLRSKVSAVTEAGEPPGNFDPGDPLRNSGPIATPVYGGFYAISPDTSFQFDVTDPLLFTDLVVRIDGRTQVGSAFAGTWVTLPASVPTYGGNSYWFPNVATLVEAARGNLEDNTVRTNSKAAASYFAVPAAQAGYKVAYFWAVENNLTTAPLAAGDQAGVKLYSPIGWSRDAAINFLTMMKTNTDAHFGFAAFSGQTGDVDPIWPEGLGTAYDNIDGDKDSFGAADPPAYVRGGTKVFEVSKVALDQVSDNYNTVLTKVQELKPYGSTNIAASLHTAIADLTDTTKYRAGAKKVIILFTDGVPNRPGSFAAAATAARAEAAIAQSNYIPIYTIGLATNPAIQPYEDALLNESPTGIAGISHPSAKYFLVTSSSSLNDAFRVIARQLVQLTVQR